MNMDYREYGRTGKEVSAIGFGGLRFPKEDYQSGNYENSVKIIHRAHELGVNYFDTAPDYCDEHSEDIFGQAFQTMDRSTFYVSTKCGLWNAADGDEARKVLEKSLTKMGLQKIDFFHIWAIKTMEDYAAYMKKGGIYEGILKAKEEGLVDHICFSTHLNGDDIAKVAQEGVFEGVTLGYNAVNFAYRRKVLEAYAKAGMGITTMNPLGGGIIPQHPDRFSFIRQNTEEPIAVSALKFILAQPEITIALVGMNSVKDVEESVIAGEHIIPATPDLLENMGKHLTQELDALCTGCSYCDECPVDIAIPKLMDAYNEFVLTGGDSGAVKERLKVQWSMDNSTAARCVACGKCETLCTQKLPIIDRLKQIACM